MSGANLSSTATTAASFIEMDESPNSSAAPEKRSCSELGNVTPCLFGGSFETIAAKSESTALCSEMKVPTLQASLSDRLTPSLITAGLVKGIIPTLMQKESGRAILASVSRRLVGTSAEELKADS